MKCKPNWFGKLCNTYCNPNGKKYTCDRNGKVICFPGYLGPSCTQKDYCYHKPCAKNAQCKNTDVGFKCVCGKNWFGKLCDAHCDPTGKNFSCDENGKSICFPGYLGPSCTQKDYCYHKPCAKNAQCKNTDVGFKCVCGKNWFGKFCDAHCDPTGKNFSCDENGKPICFPGYLGPSCTQKDYCYHKPCAKNAQCKNTDVGFKCVCGKNWFGKLCDAHCDPTGKNFSCDETGKPICFPGYFGPSCTRKDYCFSEPCVEKAQCENTDVGFNCTRNGTEDVTCYATYKPCLNETCSEHGVCKPSPGSADGFECECKGRWRGKRCKIHVDACEFEAKRLQELDANETAICLNNGTCVSDPNGLDFHCQCLRGWGGIRCEKQTHQGLATSISTSIAVVVCLMVVVLVAIVVGKKVSGRKRLFQHGFIYSTQDKEKQMIMSIGDDRPNSRRNSSHIYAYIDPDKQFSDEDRSSADCATPLYPPGQTAAAESTHPRGAC